MAVHDRRELWRHRSGGGRPPAASAEQEEGGQRECRCEEKRPRRPRVLRSRHGSRRARRRHDGGWGTAARTVALGTVSGAGDAVAGRAGLPRSPTCPQDAERSVAAEAASNASAPSSFAPVRTGVPPRPFVPPAQARLLQEPFRARLRSTALTRPARARRPRAPAEEQAPRPPARLWAGRQAAVRGAASRGRRSHADRRHAGYPAGRGEPRPAHLATRSSRPSRLPPHRPRLTRSPNRAA